MHNILRKLGHVVPRKYTRIFVKLYHYFTSGNYKNAFVHTRSLRDGVIEDINLFEKSYYSQNGEDGIIDIIFHKIGTTNNYCVEFGVEDGSECLTRYLTGKKGWNSLLMDASDSNPSYIKKEVVTAENINSIFRKYDVPRDFDLLSIDIDYNTYWVWKALDKDYKPRVVIIEYNASIPVDESKTVPYDPDTAWDGTDYFGGSLLAMVNLGKEKGYTLIGCDNRGINAFFLRDELLENNFLIKDVEKLYKAPKYGLKEEGVWIGNPRSGKEFIRV